MNSFRRDLPRGRASSPAFRNRRDASDDDSIRTVKIKVRGSRSSENGITPFLGWLLQDRRHKETSCTADSSLNDDVTQCWRGNMALRLFDEGGVTSPRPERPQLHDAPPFRFRVPLGLIFVKAIRFIDAKREFGYAE